jgi:hypothetical protein
MMLLYVLLPIMVLFQTTSARNGRGRSGGSGGSSIQSIISATMRSAPRAADSAPPVAVAASGRGRPFQTSKSSQTNEQSQLEKDPIYLEAKAKIEAKRKQFEESLSKDPDFLVMKARETELKSGLSNPVSKDGEILPGAPILRMCTNSEPPVCVCPSLPNKVCPPPGSGLPSSTAGPTEDVAVSSPPSPPSQGTSPSNQSTEPVDPNMPAVDMPILGNDSNPGAF